MPSINLLPENFTIEAYKKREKIAIYILAVFFLLCSGVVYGLVELDRRSVEKESEMLDTEITNVKKQIDTEIKKSDLLSSDYEKKDIEKILGDHLYLSKAAIFPRELIVEDVYLESLSLNASDNTLMMNMLAKDYDSFLAQIAAVKGSFWIESFNLGNISKDKDTGAVGFSIGAVMRKDMLVFSEHYRDFGLGILAGKVNRYIKINTYSVLLKKASEGESKMDEKVIVNFSGEAYDRGYLNEFEKSLKSMDEVAKITLQRDEFSNLKPGVINFEGSLELKY